MSINSTVHGKGFHIAHLNVRSMFGGHKFDTLKNQIGTSGVDLFTLSETWLNAAITDKLVEITPYTVTRLDRGWSDHDNNAKGSPKRGGGLACFIKDGIKFSDTKLAALNMSSADLEMQWITINLGKVRPIVVINIYRPPQGSYKTACKFISEAFEKADLKDNTDIFILGDFNINFKDSSSPAFKELSFTMKSLGLSQLVKETTRPSQTNGRDTSTLIDLIFTNSDAVANVKLLDINISDHLAVMVTRKKSYIKPTKVEFKGRSYRNYVKEDFQDNLGNHNWDNFYTLNDPNALWLYMREIITNTINPMCPLKHFYSSRSPRTLDH